MTSDSFADSLRWDDDARQRLRTSLDESLLVEAAAGTGKTTVLVERLVAVLETGRTTVDRIVAVTFTRKAAGELELRLRQELDRARSRAGNETVRTRLANAIARLEEAHIGTIHSFCAEILHERPVEAEIDPAFVELDDEEAGRLYDRAFRQWLERKLEEMPEGLRRALARLAEQRSFDGSTPLDRLRRAGRSLVDWRDFDAPWRREPFDREDVLGRLVDTVESFQALRIRGASKDPLFQATAQVGHVVMWIRRSEDASGTRDFDELEALLVDLLRDLRRKASWNQGRTQQYAPDLPRNEVREARDRLLGELEDFDRQAGAELASLLRDELRGVLDLYEDLKHRAGRLDFLDLLVRCRDLLRQRADVRRDLQGRFSHIFVDEFQDTDPLQTEILLLLSAAEPQDASNDEDWTSLRPEPGKLLLVGDPKQSIYRFRRADVLLYQELKQNLTREGEDGPAVGLVHLSRSFRATEPVQQAINAAFEPAMQEDLRAGQPAYVPLLGGQDASPSQPSVVALPVPEPFGWRGVTKKAVEESLPDAVAAWIDWLIHHSGWTVRDPEATERRIPIAPRHVCLLFRRFLSWGRDATEPYQRALEARGLPHLLVGGRSFHQREEVETIRAALTAIEWPDDALSVYAALRGELFGLVDSTLLRWRRDIGRFDPLAPRPSSDDLDDDELRGVADALGFLRQAHLERNRIPVAETVHRLLEHTRAHAGLALRPAGHQVLANVQRILDLARSFEMRGGLSFRGFVERLDDEAQRPGSGEAPVIEEGAEGIRMMTVHAAKGLEFPIALPVDLTTNPTGRNADRYLDARDKLCAQRLLGAAPWELLTHGDLELERDRAESVRLAYVAATRARDLLVVPALGTRPWADGWLSPLDPALRPADPHQPEAAPGTPNFGPTTVLTPPQDLSEELVRPGLHRPQRGSHRVVWWDPSCLHLKVEGHVGVRRWRLLAPDEEAESDGLERWLDWQQRRDRAVADGSRPSQETIAVTETQQWPPGDPPEIELAVIPRDGDRPQGRRFGTLVHTLFKDSELSAAPAEIASLARFHGRQLEATSEEVQAAIEAVRAALGHPLLLRAQIAEEVQREVPFLLRVANGLFIEGVLDLAFRDDTGWIVIDFKTDVEIEAKAEHYRRQLAWYIHAVQELRGDRDVRGVLLGV
ncbi:MAG: UvrD-helicase domain-containing protein [Thermoanaerobaculia bacterium]|nr:UvrD-helicase domain-containing protein [Thermoanaerobaculia bacterium]